MRWRLEASRPSGRRLGLHYHKMQEQFLPAGTRGESLAWNVGVSLL